MKVLRKKSVIEMIKILCNVLNVLLRIWFVVDKIFVVEIILFNNVLMILYIISMSMKSVVVVMLLCKYFEFCK